MSNFDAILIRRIGDHWYTLLGRAGDEYSDGHFTRHALPSETRAKAFANARALAVQQGIPESRIFEDAATPDEAAS